MKAQLHKHVDKLNCISVTCSWQETALHFLLITLYIWCSSSIVQCVGVDALHQGPIEIPLKYWSGALPTQRYM